MLVEPVYIQNYISRKEDMCTSHVCACMYIYISPSLPLPLFLSLVLSTPHQFPNTASEFSIIQLIPSALYESQATELPLVSRKTFWPTPPPRVAL